jgi:hypothetical protein
MTQTERELLANKWLESGKTMWRADSQAPISGGRRLDRVACGKRSRTFTLLESKRTPERSTVTDYWFSEVWKLNGHTD